MDRLLGLVGVADVGGTPVHVQVVGETDAGRLLVQRVGRQEPVTLIERTAFVAELAIAPEPLSDGVRSAALDLSQAIERAKAMAGTDHLLDQEDYQILHDELEETDQYPFAAALVEHGVQVRTGGRQAVQDVVTDPHGEADGLALHPEPWASPGGAGEAAGAGMDGQDAPAFAPWDPGGQGDGISNEEAHTEHEFPGVRTLAQRDYGQASNATNETMPSHIWTHEVSMAAIHAGVPAAFVDKMRDRISRAYGAGEAVWMVADELVFRWQRSEIEDRSDHEMDFLRQTHPKEGVRGRSAQFQPGQVICQDCGKTFDQADAVVPGHCPACADHDYPFVEDARKRGQVNRLTVDPEDLAADYKARGLERTRAWGEFVKDRALQPEMDAKQFYAIFDQVSPARLPGPSYETAADFQATHLDTLTDTKVQITPTDFGHKLVWEGGMTGSNPGPLDEGRFKPIARKRAGHPAVDQARRIFQVELAGAEEQLGLGLDHEVRTGGTENVEEVCFECGVPWNPASGFVAGPQDTPFCKGCSDAAARWVERWTQSKGRRRGPPYFYDHNTPVDTTDLPLDDGKEAAEPCKEYCGEPDCPALDLPDHEAEMGWSGSELVDERWASVSMMDIAKHPLGRPHHDLEKDSDLGTPSGRERGLNPSVHEQANQAYGSDNQFEDADLHMGRVRTPGRLNLSDYFGPVGKCLACGAMATKEAFKMVDGWERCPACRSDRVGFIDAGKGMRDLVAGEADAYETAPPLSKGDGEGVFDDQPDGVTIQPHASAGRSAQGIGISGDAFEDPGAGEPLDPHDEDAAPDPKDFGVMVSMRQLAQGVDNRSSDPNVQTDVDEQQGDRGIARPPAVEDVRYPR